MVPLFSHLSPAKPVVHMHTYLVPFGGFESSQVPEFIQARCREAVTQIVKRAGYRYGYFHCEFIITQSNCYLIDPNMGRLSGGAFVQHLGLHHQIEPENILRHVIDLGLFNGRQTEGFSYSSCCAATEKRTIAINYCVEEAGIFDRATAARFRTEILEVGGSRDFMDAYVAFRGRKPTLDALLRQSGIGQAA